MTFLYPYVLFALVIPAVLALAAALRQRSAGNSWRQLVSPAHPELVHRRPRWQVVLPTALALLALTGIILAAARPINGYVQSEGAATGRNLLIALDISRSMETQDVSPSRLEEARAAAYELIEALPGDKIGLIVFSGEADVVVPLTYDHTALRDALEQVNRSWAGYGGTNFGLLLRCAMQNFARSAPDGANALVILSDGEDTVDSSLQIAEEAKKNNLLVITVGIGTPAGGAIPDPQGDSGLWEDASGRHVISKLDMNALRRFSEATGGDFFTMSSGADLSAFAREAANKLERHEETFATGRVPMDLFMWFAVPSLFALLASIILGSEWSTARRHMGAAALLLLTLSTAQPTLASTQAPDAYAQGLQAIQDGKADDAREKLSQALLAEDSALQAAAHLALGNMQTRATFDKLRQLYEPAPDGNGTPATPGIEDLQKIVEELNKNLIPYQDALEADSSLEAARSNSDKVKEFIKKLEEEIERLKEQQNQQNKDDQQDKQDQQNKDDQQDKQDQQDKDDQQDKQDQQDKDDQQDKQDQQDKDDQQDKQDQQDKDDQQDKQDQQNKDDQQDKQDQQGKDDQQDKQDQQDKDDQQDKQDQQGKDDQQDKQDQQGKDDQQDKQDQQNKDDQQDKQDQQNKDDQQDKQDQQSKDGQQDKQDQQGKDDQQDKQNQQQGDAYSQQAAAQQELSDEEKAKQRAASILRMHLDEEKGSPIPHDNRAVRPPSKDY